jgi:hypothetical protein
MLSLLLITALLCPAGLAPQPQVEPQPKAEPAPAYAGCLLRAYPDHLCGATADHLIWCDGTRMPWTTHAPGLTGDALLNAADLRDQMATPYPTGAWQPPPTGDPGRARSEAFFRKMYGDDARAVARTTRKVKWVAGKRLKVTTTNAVDQRLAAVAAELATLPKAQRKFIKQTSGAFVWRTIKGTKRLSMHSFAVAVDVGVPLSDYWRWNKPDPNGHRAYRNRFPPEIAAVFERHGFIWGGKWLHFDTMHFEYRPELLDPACTENH